MDKQPLIDLFKKNRVLPDAAIEVMVGEYEERHFDKNEYFLKQGRVSEALYLTGGFMRAYAFDREGNELTTNFFVPGSAVSEPASFFLRTESMENIQAITECQTYTISYDRMNKLFHSVPEFREFGREMLVKELVTLKQRTLAMIQKSAEERYAALINEVPEIFQRVQLKYIASYLGVTDTSLSRIRKEFSKKAP